MLTRFQKQKLTNLFAIHDLDRDGMLEQSDYVEYTRRLAGKRGVEPGSAQYDELLSRFLGFWDMLREIADQNQNRSVTLREWFACFEQLLSLPDAAENMGSIGKAVFGMLDRNGDGVVTLDEYRWLYSSGALDPTLAGDSFKRLDTDHDGRITTAELSTRLVEFLTSDNPESPGTWLFGPVATPPEGQMADTFQLKAGRAGGTP
jgi:Ca2+-binding EF-hand superfamily protein